MMPPYVGPLVCAYDMNRKLGVFCFLIEEVTY